MYAPAAALARGVEHGGGQVHPARGLELDGAAQGVGHDVGWVGHHAVGEDAAAQRDGLGGGDVHHTRLKCDSRHVKQAGGGLREGVGQNGNAASSCRQDAASWVKTCRRGGRRDGATVLHVGGVEAHTARRSGEDAAGGVCLDGAAVEDAAAGLQQDAARTAHQARGLDAAAVVDHAALQSARGLGRQDDEAARGLDGVLVLDQRVDGRGRHAQRAEGAVAIKLELEGLARSQGHGAEVGHDNAVVTHFGRQQGDVAAQSGTQLALVDDRARRAVAGQLDLPVHELLVGRVVRGGHEAAHVHAGRLAEVDALRVD